MCFFVLLIRTKKQQEVFNAKQLHICKRCEGNIIINGTSKNIHAQKFATNWKSFNLEWSVHFNLYDRN